jgi:hypothetical protein
MGPLVNTTNKEVAVEHSSETFVKPVFDLVNWVIYIGAVLILSVVLAPLAPVIFFPNIGPTFPATGFAGTFFKGKMFSGRIGLGR